MIHQWGKNIFKNVFGVRSRPPLPFFQKRFRNQRRNDVTARREVPAIESPAAKGRLDSMGAMETRGEESSGEEIGFKIFLSYHVAFSVYIDF
jgi:hypothetical protein